MRRLAAIVVVLVVVVPAVASAQEAAKPAPAPVSKRDRERRAESAFVAGRYQEAAELLDGLYVEFHNPVYLRNLGRCHQRLKNPDAAIAAFEEYLHRAKGIPPAERDEVTGFIREMEELKKQQQAAAAPPPPPPVITPAAAPVVATQAPTPAVMPQPMQTVETAPAPRSSGSGKLVGGILLGAGALLAAGGGYMLNSSWSEFHRGQHLGCPAASELCGQVADKVSSKALVGKILFGAAIAAGLAGGTVLVLSFSGGSERTGTGMNVALGGKF
jgi:hypothetical protein